MKGGEYYNNQRHFDRSMEDEIYNVARNPLGAVCNAPLPYYPGKELHSLILTII